MTYISNSKYAHFAIVYLHSYVYKTSEKVQEYHCIKQATVSHSYMAII